MFSEAKLQELRKLNLLGKKLFSSNFFGSYRSFMQSVGLDFVKLQEYQEGDDIRLLDWNAFAKTGESLMTKKMAPEKDRALILAIDASSSMNYSSEEVLKSSLLRDFVYALSWLASYSKDRVGILLFGADEIFWLPSAAGKKQVFSIFDMASEKIGNLGKTDLSKGIEFLLKMSLRKSLVFFASDFLDANFFKLEKLWLMLSKKHYTIPVVVSDKLERSFDEHNFMFMVQDCETKNVVCLESSHELSAFLQQRQAEVINFFAKKNVHPLMLDTSEDMIAKLIHYFSSSRVWL